MNDNNKYNIITLCGSIKFKDEFLKLQEKLTLDGNIVLTPNFFNNVKKEEINLETKKMLDEMAITLKQYGKLNHRNKKKDEQHLLKHSMHLVRLYLMGIDILQGNGIKTYREDDRELLLDIRNGKYSYEQIYNMAEKLEEEFKDVLQTSKLPEKLDYNKINNLVAEINKQMLK